MPYPLPLTRTEAYLAYKAGVIQQSGLKPSLAVPRNGIDAWLAYWTGIAEDYPKREDGTPHILQEEEAYIAYLSGVINEYPEKCLRRVGAYLRYLISARWGRPDHPLNREELYLSLIKTQFIPSGDPSSDIVIDGTAKAPFVDVKMYGDTFQQTYTGKNLYYDTDGYAQGFIRDNGDISYSTSSVSNKTYIKASGNTQYVVSFNSIVSGTELRGVGCYDSNKDFIRRILATEITDGSFQTAAGTAYIRVYFYNANGLNATNFPTNYISDIQLELGSTATDFEPYTGGQPSPSPDYPQPIKTVTGLQTVEVQGKNLFDSSVTPEHYGHQTVTGRTDGSMELSVTTSNSNATWSEFAEYLLQLEPNTTYTLSRKWEVVSGEQYRNAGAIRTHIGSSYSAATTSDKLTFTTDASGVTRLLFYTAYLDQTQGQVSTAVRFYDVLLEKGDTVTSFEQYSKQLYTINLDSIELCKLGTYQDYIYKDGDDWKVHKATSKYTFDGSEAWTWDTARIPRLYLTSGALAGLGIHAKMPPDSTTMPVGLTNRFIAKPFTNFYTDNESDGFAMSTSGQNFQIGDKNWTQRTEAEAAANGLIWYHALATGYETDTIITNQALIDQLNALKRGGAEEGTTYIKVSATDPNLPAKLYVEAPKYE